MAQKEIVLRIYPDGTLKSQTKNIKGKACLKYVQLIEELTASKAIESEFTSEYYETEQVLTGETTTYNEEVAYQYNRG